MEKVKTFIAILGAIMLIVVVAKFVSAANVRASRDAEELRQFHMEFHAIHP